MSILGSSTIAIIGTRTLPEVTVQSVDTSGDVIAYWRFNYQPLEGTFSDLEGLQVFNEAEETWMQPLSYSIDSNTIELEYPFPALPGAAWRVLAPANGWPFDDPDSDDALGLTLGQTGTIEE